MTIKKGKTLQFKHGWNESDQEEISDLTPFCLSNYMDEESPCASTRSTSPEVYSPRSSSGSAVSEADEFIWDDSPEQISLQFDSSNNHVKPQLPPPFTRNRVVAISRPPLRRQPAFRTIHPTHAFRQPPRTPENAMSTPHVPPPVKKSRIPTPISPSQVLLDQVNDLSRIPSTHTQEAMPQTPRRSSRLQSRAESTTIRNHKKMQEGGTTEDKTSREH